MGIENMRRWPMYIVFAVCILLTLSLFNNWSSETELQNKVGELSAQLQECSKAQTLCMEESLTLLEQKEGYNTKITDLEKERVKLKNQISEYVNKVSKAEIQANRTISDLDVCKAELKSSKNNQENTLETLKLEKDKLTTELAERKEKINELEKEILKLKSALTTKSAPNPSAPSKVTPAAQPPKLSPALNAHNPINEPVLENNAKEELEDPNALNDFDQPE